MEAHLASENGFKLPSRLKKKQTPLPTPELKERRYPFQSQQQQNFTEQHATYQDVYFYFITMSPKTVNNIKKFMEQNANIDQIVSKHKPAQVLSLH